MQADFAIAISGTAIGFEDLISDLLTNLMEPASEVLSAKIAPALKRIQSFFGVDECALIQFPPEPGRPDSAVIYQHDSVTIDAASRFARHPWSYQRLVQQKKPVIFSSPQSLPPEASTDRMSWEQEGVVSALMLPIDLGFGVAGAIILKRHLAQEWPISTIQRLGLIGFILAQHLQYVHTHGALMKSEREMAEAQHIAHVGNWEWV